MAGYSGTPLVKKLGFKEGSRVRIQHAPKNYQQLVSPGPANVTISPRLANNIDIVHCFCRSANELSAELPQLMRKIRQDGMIWVSWPKKASGVKTDITEDTIRSIALPLGLVDIKVCAVDDTWSGLKLVFRKDLRK